MCRHAIDVKYIKAMFIHVLNQEGMQDQGMIIHYSSHDIHKIIFEPIYHCYFITIYTHIVHSKLQSYDHTRWLGYPNDLHYMVFPPKIDNTFPTLGAAYFETLEYDLILPFVVSAI